MSTAVTQNAPIGDQAAKPDLTDGNRAGKQAQCFLPRFDIWEGDDAWVLYGDLPGVSSEHLDVQFEDHRLTIHGKVAHHQDSRTLWYGEYGVGDFQRSFTVGESVDAAKISAELKNGVLTVRLPKQERAKARRIEIQAH